MKWVGVALLNYGGREVLPSAYQWVYFDQSDCAAHRIHYPSSLSDHMTPSAETRSLQAEISFSRSRPLAASLESLSARVWDELRAAGFVEGSSPAMSGVRACDYGYAIMDLQRIDAVKYARQALSDRGIVTCGRFGEWDYLWTDRVIQSGRRAAGEINARTDS